MADNDILPTRLMERLKSGKVKHVALIEDIPDGYCAYCDRGGVFKFNSVYSNTVISYHSDEENVIVYLETMHIDIMRTLAINSVNKIGW